MVYAKQIFDDVRTVRSPNSAASTGSYVWAAFLTVHLLKEYQRHNWVEHPKTSSILALTSMGKTFRFDQSSTPWFLIPTWESVQHRSSKHC
jgi:hypothetical protein